MKLTLKHLCKILVILTAAASIQIAHAEKISSTKLTKIWVYKTYAVVQLESGGNNEDACTKKDSDGSSNAKYFVALDFEGQTGKEMFSTILTARTTGMEVSFGTSCCHNWGDGTVPLIYRVDL